jgi:hypothetical protein
MCTQDQETQGPCARRQIENLMGRYEYFHTAGLDEHCFELFAQRTPGTKVAIAQLGIYDGIESIRRFYVGAGSLGPSRKGVLIVHTLTTPVIEVAADGQSAQGVWISPGVETAPGGHTAPAALEDGVWVSRLTDVDRNATRIRATWAWVRYGADFVLEDGCWRIWHLAIHRLFTAEHDRDWLDPPPRQLPPFPDELMPDQPNPHDWTFNRDAIVDNVPAPPEPYDTWDNARAYVQ